VFKPEILRVVLKMGIVMSFVVRILPYFPAHKTHRDFFVRNFRKKK